MKTSFQRKKKTTSPTNSNLIENGPSQKSTQVKNCMLSLKGVLELISVSNDDSDCKPALRIVAKHRKGFGEGRWGGREIFFLIVIILFLC